VLAHDLSSFNMGATLSSRSDLSEAMTVEINAPVDFVWNMLTAIEDFPDIASNVMSVERIGGGESFKAGTKWKEVRKFRGKTLVIYKTVTDIADNPRSFSVSITFGKQQFEGEKLHYWSHSDAETATMIFQPINETTCNMIFTLAYSSSSCWGRTWMSICRCCIMSYGRKYFQLELDDVAAAAEKRYQKSMQSSQ
jgi:hypothetical protein